MKIKLASEGKGNEVLHQNKWYRKDVEYDVDFSTAMRLKRNPDFVVDMQYEQFPYDPESWSKRKEVAIIEDIDPFSGWGNVGMNLIKYSPEIKFAQVGKLWGVREPSVIAASQRSVNHNGAALWHTQPKSEWLLSPFSRNLAITPFETTRVPQSWVSRLNFMDAVLVPCEQNIQMMKDSGVTVPVELIHWGVDTDKFRKLERRAGRPFTFGHMGALSIRKGTDILVRAFLAAFPDNPNVRLLNKTSHRGYPFMAKDPRIVVKMGEASHEDLMQDFFAEIDCFVYPTLGEGFGLAIPEAMATGVPAIATGWSGPCEYMRDDVGWTIDYTLDKAREFDANVYREDCGNWAIPDFDHLMHLMRYAYDHQDETRRKGDAAAAYIAEEWTWKAQIPLFHKALATHL